MIQGLVLGSSFGMPGWMLLDQGLYTLDGSECNKIGTSFQAFQFESDKCHRFVGSCLANQLLDFAEQVL